MIPQPLSELADQASEVRSHALGVIIAGVVAAAVISWIFSGFLSKRVQTVSAAARRMASGDRDSRVPEPKWYDPVEVSELARSFNQMSAAIETASDLQGEALYRAESASKAKTNFLANVSHEFRTPLNAILGFSETIKMQTFGPIPQPKYIEYGNDIHESGQHLLSLIDDLIDMSRIEANLVEPHKDWHDLSRLVRKSIKLVENRAAARNVDLVNRIPARRIQVYADERMLIQVFSNLLSNSVKFSPPEAGVEIEALPDQQGNCAISVLDQGHGISETDLARAFNPFWQSPAKENVNSDGIGLGLSIVRQLVRAHGGDIRIENRAEGGLKATVTLPRDQVREYPGHPVN